MHRVIAIVSGGLALAACSSLNLDFLKPGPVLETVRFESQPPGAEAKVSNGQTCRTPCALALPAGGPYTVTYTLNGYQPERIKSNWCPWAITTSRLEPNPVLIDLNACAATAAGETQARREEAYGQAGRQTAPAPKPATGNAAPPPPPPPAATSPWPATPPQQR